MMIFEYFIASPHGLAFTKALPVCMLDKGCHD